MVATISLRILQTTDLHAEVRPYDYFLDRPSTGGLATLAADIESSRREAPLTLLFDSGDFLQGSPIADLPEAKDADPVIAAMNAAGYDAATLGNHDLDFGLDRALAAARQANFPVVSASLTDPQGTHLLPPTVLLKRKVSDSSGTARTLRIGVTGALPIRTETWTRHHIQGHARVRPMLAALADAARHLVSDGADIVVALSHSGVGHGATDPDEEAVSRLVAEIAGIDVVLAGHTHETAATVHAGVPIVQAGSHARRLGLVDLTLARVAGRWRPVEARAAIRPLGTGGRAAPAVMSATEDAHRRTVTRLAQSVAQTEIALSNAFAPIFRDPVGRLVADVMRAWARPHVPTGTDVLAAVAPARIGSDGACEGIDIPAGPLARRHVAAMSPFANEARLLRVNGATLLDWLDHAAGVYAQIEPDRTPAPLLDSRFAPYNADVIHGLDYGVDLSIPPRFTPGGKRTGDRRRIVEPRLNGRQVEQDATYVIATTSYRAAGGGGYDWLSRAEPLPAPRTILVDLLADYLATVGVVSPPVLGPGRLLAPAGTRVLFDTTHAARHRLDTIAEFDPQVVASSDDRRLRLSLAL